MADPPSSAAAAAASSCRLPGAKGGSARLSEAERLQADIRRMPFECDSPQKKADRQMEDTNNKWLKGVAFEQVWIGKFVVDMFQLSPAGSTHVSRLESRLFSLLRATIPPRHSSEPLEPDDIQGCGVGISVRRMKGNKPEGASAEQLAELTAPHLGTLVSGCVVEPLYSVQMREPSAGKATRCHALYLHYAATKEGEQRKGFMRFLLDGQVRLMAATWPNAHSSHNVIFVNSTRSKENCLYRRKPAAHGFGFVRDTSTSQFSEQPLLQPKANAALCCRSVEIKVDQNGQTKPPQQGDDSALQTRIQLLLAIKKRASSPPPPPKPQQLQPATAAHQKPSRSDSLPALERGPLIDLEAGRHLQRPPPAPHAAAAAAPASSRSGSGAGVRLRPDPSEIIDLVSSDDDEECVKME